MRTQVRSPSGSNAISGISVIGAIVIAGRLDAPYDAILGVAAVALATINVVGGFLVTDRMLRMFRRTPAANRDATRSA